MGHRFDPYKPHHPVFPNCGNRSASCSIAVGFTEIVLDPFLGSGSTLIAAENTGRVCCGIELDPLYVDVIIRRYEAETGAAVILADSGETFEKVAARRRNDESD